MINNIILISTLFFFLNKISKDELLIYMPSFYKYCGYKPNIIDLKSTLKNMKLCLKGYTPKSIIITKDNYNQIKKDICIFNVICSKNNINVPEIILYL